MIIALQAKSFFARRPHGAATPSKSHKRENNGINLDFSGATGGEKAWN
jgi:hypothetical protein